MSVPKINWSQMTAPQRIQHAIFRAYVKHPVIGQLVGVYRHQMTESRKLRVRISEGVVMEVDMTDCPTACADGQTVYYNPDFVMTLSRDSMVFLVLHEVLHNILAHHVRRGKRDPEKWNVAIDGAINQILLGESFGESARSDSLASRFPAPDGLHDGIDVPSMVKNYGVKAEQVKDASGEAIYNVLPDMPPPKCKGGKGKGDKGDPSDIPGLEHAISEALADAKLEEEGRSSQEEINEQVSKLMRVVQMCKNIGKLPMSLIKMAEELVEPQVDYRSVLRDFLSKEMRGDYSYAFPSRRQSCVPDYMVLPGPGQIPGKGIFAVLFDTSGSIYGSKELISEMMSEVYGIQRDTQSELAIFYVDTEIHKIAYFDESETVRDAAPDDDRVTPVGGGGTDFRCVFEYIEKQGLQIDALIGFTDLAATFPEHAPAYPVIWIAHNEGTAPFGKTLNIKPKLDQSY